MSLSEEPPEAAAPEGSAPERVDDLLVAEPAEGTIRASAVVDVFLAVCRHCEEDIWSGPEWGWEHFENDEAACQLPPSDGGVQG